jgi:hypothetical protein
MKETQKFMMLMKNIQRETGEKSEEKRIIFKNSFTTIR